MAREQLFALLDDARERAVTWVCGPPGAGKTTLAAGWVESRGIDALWYQLDPGDGDPGTFFHYLSLVNAVAKGQLPELSSDALTRPLAFARSFFRAWFAALPDDTVVVFDNYHEIPPSGPIHAIVELAVSELPEGIHLLFISRSEPPSQFSRFHASRQLSIIDWHTLRLTLEETRRMSQVRYAVDADTVRELHERTDGWAAGVTLMLERLRRNGILPAGVEVETREAVFNYFGGVLFDRLSSDEQKALLSVALLPHASIELAQELCGSRVVAGVLESFYRHHLFTERQAIPGFVYRFHPLFRAFLLERGPVRFGESVWGVLTLRAAGLLEGDGQIEAAFSLYVRLKSWTDATRVVVRHAPLLTATGRGLTVREWLDRLPNDWRDNHPWCRFWNGVASVPFEVRVARSDIERAFEIFSSAGDRRGMLLAATQMLTAIAWNWSDFSSLTRWVSITEGLLSEPPVDTSSAERVGAYAALVHGSILGDARNLRLRNHVNALLGLLANAGSDINNYPEAGAVLGKYLHFAPDRTFLGRLRATHPSLDERSDFRWLDWKSSYAHALQRDGDHEAALALVDEALRIAPDYGTVYQIRWFQLVRCLVLLASGRVDALRAEFAGFCATITRSDDLGPNHFRTMIQAILDLVDGKFDQACANAQESVRLADASGFAYIRLRTRPLLAVALAHCKRFDEAETALSEGFRIAAGTVFWYAPNEMEFARAYVLVLAGKGTQAHASLRTALSFARTKDDTWDFLDLCAPFVRACLYGEALRHGIEADLVRAIIQRHKISPPNDANEDWPWPLRIRTLGRFEIARGGQSLMWGRKAPKKMMELLKVLIANGCENVRETVITDALWPDVEGDAGHSRYGVMLLRLRRWLGDPTLLRQENGMLSLDLSRTWVDVYQLLFKPRRTALGRSAIRLDTLAIEEFLPDDADAPWARIMRSKLERLRNRPGQQDPGLVK
ncbi:MAG: hypothetical protein ACKVP2_18630 [Burkholderiales bacterium]